MLGSLAHPMHRCYGGRLTRPPGDGRSNKVNTVRSFSVITLVGALLLAASSLARAQALRGVMAADVGVIVPTGNDLNAAPVFRVSLRVPDGQWSAILDVSHFELASTFLELGLTRLMGGVAYTRATGRLAISPAVLAGYAIGYVGTRGFSQASITLSNCFTWEPQLGVTWRGGRHLGVGGAASYVVARPTLDFGNVGGSPPGPWKLDGFVAAVRVEGLF